MSLSILPVLILINLLRTLTGRHSWQFLSRDCTVVARVLRHLWFHVGRQYLAPLTNISRSVSVLQTVICLLLGKTISGFCFCTI